MSERAYYEAESLWDAERFDRADEKERLELCGALVPHDALTLLDVGAGQGAFLRWLEVHRSGLVLHGLERSEAAIARSVSQTVIQQGSIDALPFDDRSIDVVTALEVLEHLPFGLYDAGVRELARVTARAIVVSVPYAEQRQRSRCSYCGCQFHAAYHMRSFRPETIPGMFDGFALDRQHAVMSPDYIAGPFLRAAWIRLHGGVDRTPRGSLCPQCGYREEGNAAGEAWARQIVTRLPTRQRPRWLVVRFHRK